MNTRIIPALLGALLFSGVAEAAPSIYPVDTARFLGGSRFDFKVEFDGELAEKDAKVLINGQDAKAVLGAKPEFIAKEKGARRCLPLKVSGPFHTPLMAPAGDALAERFRTVEFREPQIPVIFNCLGAERPDGAAIPELLVRQVQSSVYMEDSLRRMAAMGLDALVEIGPGKALSGFVKKTVPELPVYAVETAAELEQLTETLKGASL